MTPRERQTLLIGAGIALEALVHLEIFPIGSISARLLQGAAFIFAMAWPPPRHQWSNEKRIKNGLKPLEPRPPLDKEETRICRPPSK
jgi:hypothetical protein